VLRIPKTPACATAPPAPQLALVALLSALAVLTKEIALILPLVVAIVPSGVSWRRRVWLAIASAAGSLAAGMAAVGVLGDGGRARRILALAGGWSFLDYPIRLIWPANPQPAFPNPIYGSSRGALGLGLLATAALVAAVALLLKEDGSRGWARTGAVLLAAGWLPWAIRPDDRGIGLGCAGLALIIAGFLDAAVDRSPAIPAAALVLLSVPWFCLWAVRERLWAESGRIGELTVASMQEWRAEAGPGRLLVAAGRVINIAAGTNIISPAELDPCALSVVGVMGTPPVRPAEVRWEGVPGRYRITASPNSAVAWLCTPNPGSGIVDVECDETGRARSILIDPALLDEELRRRHCGPVEVRRWDGSRFTPF